MRVILLSAVAAVASLAITGATAAGEPTAGGLKAKVSFGDLDLAKPQGAKTMIRRLENAASRVCGGKPDIRNLAAQRFHAQCVDDALDDAIARLDAPLVSELYGEGDQRRYARRIEPDR